MSPKTESQRFRFKRAVLDAREVELIIRRLAGEIVERHHDPSELVLLGIRTRGLPLAERLQAEIERSEGVRPIVGAVDITLYRDDLSTIAPQPVVKETSIPVPLEGRAVILADDVLYTGRTVRAALDELNDYGRPRAVQLVVLVDRGHRELPIHADFVGKRLPTAANEVVKVGFESTDGDDYVHLYEHLDEAQDER